MPRLLGKIPGPLPGASNALLDRWSVVVARYNAVAIRAVGAGFGRTRRDTGPHKASSTSTHTSHDLSSDDGDEVKENPPPQRWRRPAGALTRRGGFRHALSVSTWVCLREPLCGLCDIAVACFACLHACDRCLALCNVR